MFYITRFYAIYEKTRFLSPILLPVSWVKKSEVFCAGSGECRSRRGPRDGKRRAYSKECAAFFLYIACRAHFWRRKACFMGDNLQIFFYFAWKFRGVPSTAGSPGLAQSVHYVRSSGDPTEYQPLRSCRIFIA